MQYRGVVKSESFIGQYLAYMESQETATAYDFWCALWLLSIAVGRTTIVDRPRAPVFMNLYAVLVAESGVTRKSSAIREVQKIAHRLLPNDATIGLLEGKLTPEKLDNVLHERTIEHRVGQLAIAISELAVFLGMERYTAAMPALLTDLYDCPASRKGGGSLYRGGVDQRGIFISFISASTPSWLLRSVNPNVIEGGFTSRCMFIVSDDPKRRIAWPNTESVDTAATVARLVEQLEQVRELAQDNERISINETALRVFRLWYGKRKPSSDAYRASFESREDAHILRVAAFLCINDGSWIIQAPHLKVAIRIIDEIKQSSAKLFNHEAERSKIVQGIETARGVLLANELDPIPRSKLWLKCRNHLDHAEFTAMLDVLHEIGAIQRFIMKHDGAGRPIDLIRATKLLAGRGLIDALTERLI